MKIIDFDIIMLVASLPYRRLYTIKHFVNVLLKCIQQIFNVNIMFLLLISYPSG